MREPPGPANADSFRISAEEALSRSHADIEQLPLEDLQTLIHELQVHQIELQMQNEELRLTQIQLQDSRSSYSELYEFAPVGYLTLDTAGVIQTSNLTASKLLGQRRSVLNGTKMARYMASDDQDIIHRVFLCLADSKQKQSFDCRIRNQSEHIWVHIECSMRNSNFNEWLVTLTDISRRKLAEEQLQEQQQQMAHVARISCMNEIAGSIAHEVAQPLSVIATCAYSSKTVLTQGGADQSDDLIAMNETIEEQAIHAGEILKRLRSFIEPSNNKRSTLNINEVISEALKLTASQTRAFDAKINLVLMDHLPSVVGDKVQIHQVVVNLLLNAFESMVHQPTEERLMTLCSSLVEDGVVVSVEDNGEGLSPQCATSVFDAFVTTKTTGMGLGLAISRSIIESHCGRIWVTTPETGRGAKFHFKLPVEATNADNVE